MCQHDPPTTTTYWESDTNRSSNVLIGDIIYLNNVSHFSEMINAVCLEAGGEPATDTNFYELLFAGVPTVKKLAAEKDNREPLGSQYVFRYVTAPSPVQAEIMVWKNRAEIAVENSTRTVLSCRPYTYYSWNEDELTKRYTSGTTDGAVYRREPNALPFFTQRVMLSLRNFPGLVTISTEGGLGGAGWGWMWINFDGGDLAGTPEGRYEAWVGVRFLAGWLSDAERAQLMYTPYNRKKLVSVESSTP